MRYIDALNLIKKALEVGVLHYGHDEHHILVYHEAGETSPEGWYSDDIDYCAKEIMNDQTAYDLIAEKIKEKSNISHEEER